MHPQNLIENSFIPYSFNGMEKDNEVKGEGNSYTTEYRQLDTRLGRWLSLDPLMAKFPSVGGYSAFANNPIFYTDPKGLAPNGREERQEARAIRKYEKAAKKNGYDPLNLTLEQRDELWDKVKDKRWAWVQHSEAGGDALKSSNANAGSSFYRADELQYAHRVGRGEMDAYTRTSDPRTLTINNYTWVPDNSLTVEPPGIPPGAPWSTAERNTVDLTGIVPGKATITNANITVTRLPGAALNENVTVSDAGGVLGSQTLGVGNNLNVNIPGTNFTLSTNRNAQNGIGMGVQIASWPWYNVNIQLSYVFNRTLPAIANLVSSFSGGKKSNFMGEVRGGLQDKHMTPWVNR